MILDLQDARRNEFRELRAFPSKENGHGRGSSYGVAVGMILLGKLECYATNGPRRRFLQPCSHAGPAGP